MSFDLQTWQRDVSRTLRTASDRLRRAIRDEAPYIVYSTLGGLTLWPLVEATRGGELLPVILALGGVAGGLGGNLIAERIQAWALSSDDVDEEEVIGWVQEQATAQVQVRDALDDVLLKLESVSQAQAGLTADEGRRFHATLQRELATLGNASRYNAVLIGSGSIVQGEGAVGAGAGGFAAGGPVYGPVILGNGNIIGATGTETAEEHARRRYLTHLFRQCNALPLGPLGGEESTDEEITLDKVYIALDTTTSVPLSEEEKRERSGRTFDARGEERRLTALEAALQAPRMVLLGQPGGGKSSFVRQLCAMLAYHHLGGGSALPEDVQRLLPVFIALRDLTPRLRAMDLEAIPEDLRREALAACVRDHLLEGLRRLDASAFEGEFLDRLTRGECLLVFDGLDEVPDDLRVCARRTVQAALSYYQPQRAILTCRVRSYVGDAILPHVVSHTLAPFDRDKIADFCRAWYRAQRDLGRIDAATADDKADDLARAANTEELIELSSNPLLLTVMAMIHQRDHGLPKERVRLYSRAVSVLLGRWHRWILGRPDHEAALGADLVALLRDESRVQRLVERLAYEAHRQRRDSAEAGALTRGRAVMILESPECLGSLDLAGRFLSFVDQRAGILVGEGGAEGHPSHYSFPHRTFQEYLAGCYIAGLPGMAREVWERVREGSDWQLAAQLAAEELHYNDRRGDLALLDLAYRLLPNEPAADVAMMRAALWSGQMAALLGARAIRADTVDPEGGDAYLRRLLPRLIEVMRGDQLTAPERCDAGNALAALGDPRDEVTTLEGMQFCFVSAGPFWMASGKDDELAIKDEKPLHPQDVPYGYWLGRYPVTVAQYREYVQSSGHEPEDADALRGLDNHPVVRVRWQEARSFCDWLTEAWQERGLLPTEWVVRLPTEPEWEKAARGGDKVPTQPFIASAQAGWAESCTPNLSPNGESQRRYPWGKEPDPNRANYDKTGIGSTSAVGCFSAGASPYGVEEMSGNVWEWTGSLWGKNLFDPEHGYPYDPDDGREAPDAGDDVLWVVRGGSFGDDGRYGRCAVRLRLSPYACSDSVGFRVVVAPV
jgi:formylglycine-generating enzyme required for sulfatase activity